jgi:hypothetical protein
MAAFEFTMGNAIILAIIAIFIASFFMWLGAKIARVENSTFGRSIVAAVASGFITWLLSIIFIQIPSMSNITGFIIGLILTIIVIKAAYGTSFGKALLVWIFQIISEVIALVIGIIVFSSAFPV